jgi:hypothetical protein
MSNSPSLVDLRVALADQLAAAISDGTWQDVIGATKQDRTGKVVVATASYLYLGQRWANFVDDFMQEIWRTNQGRRNYQLDTVGAVTDTETLATLTTNGECWRISAECVGTSATPGEVKHGKVSCIAYRSGGTVSLLSYENGNNEVGFAGTLVDLVVSGDNVNLRVTGQAAKTIEWDLRVENAERVR